MYHDKEHFTVKDVGINAQLKRVCAVEFLPIGKKFYLADYGDKTLPNGVKIHSIRFWKNTAPADTHLTADIQEIARGFFKETKSIATQKRVAELTANQSDKEDDNNPKPTSQKQS
ncbi:hypothetical protein SAMN02910356_00194 [Selenomonas sp. GACV-9]|uniref:hypothetical protein n=1 Tax=Selenomonas sp. GACV-9 TaxID=3158782 RepID=UPI0008DF7402|nr:hypothetical protein SAMN02910356_00194 [Selenomonas ruminantium]